MVVPPSRWCYMNQWCTSIKRHLTNRDINGIIFHSGHINGVSPSHSHAFPALLEKWHHHSLGTHDTTRAATRVLRLWGPHFLVVFSFSPADRRSCTCGSGAHHWAQNYFCVSCWLFWASWFTCWNTTLPLAMTAVRLKLKNEAMVKVKACNPQPQSSGSVRSISSCHNLSFKCLLLVAIAIPSKP